MKIGILQTGHAPDEARARLGDYDAMFHRLLGGHGFTFETFNVVDGQFPTGPADAAAWLITGSRHGVYEPHAWLPPLEQLIREIHAAGLPLVGVCFGHQVIAQALGGHVEKFSGGWAVGAQTYQMGGETLRLNAWHQDQVITPPPGARVLASNGFCKYAALAIGPNVLTFQPHPEFGDEMIDILATHRAPGVVPDALVASAQAALGQASDGPAMGLRIAQHLKGATQ